MPRPANALIIDDEAHVRVLLTNILKQLGVKMVWQAEDGATGISLAALHQPEVVLLDLTLPEITGIEVLEKLKEENPKIHVIVVSAQSTMRTINRAKELGAEGYVVKFAPKLEVIQMISDALDRIGALPSDNPVEGGEKPQPPA
jgi:DNA-binding NarL/FixJ family response regulator